MDAELIAMIDKQRDWSKYRENLMTKIPKGRWPYKPDFVEPMIFGAVN